MVDLNKLWQIRTEMPVVTVDFSNGRVLMHGYMNKEAFAYTLKTGKVWYYHPESGVVRMKGEHSGHIQNVVSITADCEFESLLITVEQVGHVCHKDGVHNSCYIHEIYDREGLDVAKRRKFGKLDIDNDFDYTKEDYQEEYDDGNS
jgi:phosphoribosyl-AMP cyclohydrolase